MVRHRGSTGAVASRPGCSGRLFLLALHTELAFACDHHLQGTVAGRVQSRLGVCETRYYKLLGELLDRPEAAAEPDLIGRLRALRDRRRRLRSTGRPPAD